MIFSILVRGHARVLLEESAKMIDSRKSACLGDRPDLLRALGEELLCLFDAKLNDELLGRHLHFLLEELAKIDFADVTGLCKRCVGDIGQMIVVVNIMERTA